MTEDNICRICGQYEGTDVKSHDCEPIYLSMNELTDELNARGIPSTYEMSGGGCGTIYIGSADSDGYYEMAIGPSDYVDGTATWNELCWGIDGNDFATYANEIVSRDEFNPAVVASCIAVQFNYLRSMK